MRERFWWTEADDAELRLLCFEFARAHYAHRERCLYCRAGGPYCPSLRAALYAVLEWREGRILRSKAEWLRAREEGGQLSV